MSTELHHMISLEELEANKFKTTITFDGELVINAFDKSTQIVNKSVKVNGFRQGKVPAKILKQFHPEKISSGATNLLIDEGFRLVLHENKIMPLRDPKLLKINTYPDKEDGFEFELEFDGMFEIDPVGYLNMELQVPKYNMGESVEEYLNYLKGQKAIFVPSEEIKHGTNIKCDYIIKLGEESIGEDRDQLVPVYDTELTIFGSQLVGAKVGDTVDYKYTLPEDFPQNAGEEVTIVVEIKEVLERQEPSFKKLVELMETTEEELMSFVKLQVQDSLEKNKRQILNDQVVSKLLETNDFEAPKLLVDEEMGLSSHDCGDCSEKKDSCNCNGDCKDSCDCEDSCSHHSHDKDEEKLKVAQRTVKSAYILNRIYNMEPELTLTKEEISGALEMEAQIRGMTKHLLIKQINQANAMPQFVGSLRNRKIISYIIASATITEKEDKKIKEKEDEQVKEIEEKGEENDK